MSRVQCRRVSLGTTEKSLATQIGESGLLGQICFNKHQGLSGLFWACKTDYSKAGEKNRPAAGTRNSFCYTRTRLVTVFVVTDLASTQEEHTIQLPHASADRERREKGVTPPDTQSQIVEAFRVASSGRGGCYCSLRNP